MSSFLLTTESKNSHQLSPRVMLGLLLLQSCLVMLLLLEQYAGLLVAMGITVLIPYYLQRMTNSIILLPLFLYMPISLIDGMGGLQLSELGVILFIFSGFATLCLSNVEKPYIFPALAPIMLMILAGLLSLKNARAPVAGFVLLLKHIEAFVVVYFFVVNFLYEKKDFRRILWAIAWGGVMAGIHGILRFQLGIETRVFALHGGMYGGFLGMAVISAITLSWSEQSIIMRSMLWAMLPVMIVALLLSQTRAWTFGTLLAVLLIVYLRGAKFGKFKIVFGLALIIGTVVWLVQNGLLGLISSGSLEGAAGKALQTGLLASDDKGKLLSGLMRPIVWWYGFKAYQPFPLFGIGLGNLRFRNMFTGELGWPDDEDAGFVDNHYFNILFETGIIGALGWIWLMILIYRRLKSLKQSAIDRDWQTIVYALLGALVLWAVGGFFWVLDYAHESTMMIAFLFAMVIAAERSCRLTQSTSSTLLDERAPSRTTA